MSLFKSPFTGCIFSTRHRIVEVSPRDGLQNLPPPAVPTAVKRELVERLLAAGVKNVEVGSFVRGDRVPQVCPNQSLKLLIDVGSRWRIPPPYYHSFRLHRPTLLRHNNPLDRSHPPRGGSPPQIRLPHYQPVLKSYITLYWYRTCEVWTIC